MSDLSFEIVAGVHPVGKPAPEPTRRDLMTGERIWGGERALRLMLGDELFDAADERSVPF